MKVMHIISGGDSGGAKTHLFALLDQLKLSCDVVVACFMKGVFYEEILQKDIETVLFEQKNRFDLSVVSKIERFVSERKIEIIHVHGARANFIAMFLKRRLQVPIVTTMHSDYLLDFDSFFKKLVFTNLNKISLRKLNYFIAVSDNFKDMLIERNFNPNRIYTVYNGMDYSSIPQNITSKEEFAGKYNLDTSEDLIYVGIAARFDKVKGLDVFIRGAKKAYEKNNNLRFLIAGEGAEEVNLKNLAKSLGMENIITFLGYVTDIYGFLNFIDINTLTSLNESFPYSMLEGAGMKKPMVASKVGGIPQLVREGITGYLFESEDYEEFSEKLIKISSDPSYVKSMGEEIYSLATKEFSSKKLSCDHIKIYEKIIKDFKCDKRYDFVLSGYYGFNNSGDDALLMALINDLTAEKEDVKIAVLSSNPMQTKIRYKVDAFKRMSPIVLYRLFKNSRVLLSGGGSLIQDETSSKSLWYYLFIISFAKRCSMRVMQIASGIGPVNGKFNQILAGKVLNKSVDRITLREEKSLKEIERLKISVPVEVTADPALSLEGVDRESADKIFKDNNIPMGEYVCVALRDWKDVAEDFEENIASVLDHIHDKYQKNIVFVPMQYPADLGISKRIAKCMKNSSYIIEAPISIPETIGVIANSDLVVAMRLHSLVYAVSSSVGVIALKYDPKIDGFMEYFRQNLTCDVKALTKDALIEMADAYFSDKDIERNKNLCNEMKKKAKRNAISAIELLKSKGM